MQFGTGPLSKFDYARTVAAAISMLVLKQHDSVGVTVFDSAIRAQVPASSRNTQLQAILAGLDTQVAVGKTDIAAILKRTNETLSRRSIVVLLSDLFCNRDDLFRGLQTLRQRRHDVLVLQILDDEELEFRYSGTLRFEGLENAGKLTCDPAALRAGYLRAINSFLDTIRRRCAGSNIDYQLIRTSENLDAALAHVLIRRLH
jgi:uncharacterized protein (DUF58 family)